MYLPLKMEVRLTNYNKITDLIKREIYNLHCRIAILRPDETLERYLPQEDIIINTPSYTESYNQGERRNLTFSLYNANNEYTPNVRRNMGFNKI